MTRPDLADPVAALAAELIEEGLLTAWTDAPGDKELADYNQQAVSRIVAQMAEAGYVLVSADMLAEALHDADSAKHPIGGDWRPGACPYHEGMADALLASLQDRARQPSPEQSRMLDEQGFPQPDSEVLRPYAQHLNECAITFRNYCDCGLEQALAALQDKAVSRD